MSTNKLKFYVSYKSMVLIIIAGSLICLAYSNIISSPSSKENLGLQMSSKSFLTIEQMRLDSALKQIVMELGTKKYSREELLKFKSYFSFYGKDNMNSLLMDYKVEYDNYYREYQINIYYKNESYTIIYLGRYKNNDVFRLNKYGLLVYDTVLRRWMLYCSTYDAMFKIIGYVHCVFLLNGDLTVKSAFKLGMTKPGLAFERYPRIKPSDKYLKVTKCFVSNIKFNSLTYTSFMKLLNSTSTIGNCEEFKSIVAPYFVDSPLWTDRTQFSETQI